MLPTDTGRSDKLPFVVFVLAAASFLMGTSEFVIAGLLPELAADLGVSVARAGLLITAFAIGIIVGSPTMAVATLCLSKRTTLVLALIIFAAGHIVAAASSSFPVVLAARVVTALATGAFWAVAIVVATAAAGPAFGARAIGVVTAGATLANVVGVPLGAYVGQITGWRGPFWVLAAFSIAAAATIGRFIPPDARHEIPSLRTEIAALKQAQVWLALLSAALIMGGVLAAYTYITPLLIGHTGLPIQVIPLVLIGFGAGALAGTVAGGAFGDRYPFITTITAATATSTVLFLLTQLSQNRWAAIALVFLVGLAGFAVCPVVTALAVQFAGSAPTLAASLTPSAFNIGIAVGSWLAGLALDSPLAQTGPSMVGAAISALTLVPLTVLAAIRLPAPGRAECRTTDG